MLPSTLDYYASSPSVADNCRIVWKGAPADHAIVAVCCRPRYVRYQSRKRSWHCADVPLCCAWLEQQQLDGFDDCESFLTFAKQAQEAWAGHATCRQRRKERMPFQLRDAYARLARSTSEASRRLLHRTAKQLRRNLVEDLRCKSLIQRVAEGGVIHKSRKLHPISKMKLSEYSGGAQR